MYKLKKILPVLLIAAMLVFSAAPAYAQARYGLTFTPVADDTASVLPAETWVYGIGLYGAAAAGSMGIYDCATLGEAVNATLAAPEVGVTAQYLSNFEWYPRPVYFSTAVTAVVGSGVGQIASGPEPN